MIFKSAQPTFDRTSPSKTSRWSGAHNPVPWEFLRRDAFITSIVGDTNQQTVTVWALYSTVVNTDANAEDWTEPENFIHIEHELGGVGSYTGSYKIVTRTIIKPMNMLYIVAQAVGQTNVFDQTFGPHSGVVNLLGKPNFRMEVQHLTPNGRLISGSNHREDLNGILIVNSGPTMQPEMTLKNDRDFSIIHERDDNLWSAYVLRWRERFDDEVSAASWNTEVQHYVVNGARQIGDTTSNGVAQEAVGENLAEYVLFDADIEQKFLTAFEKPRYWEGYPFDFTMIIDQDIENSEWEWGEVVRNLNDTIINKNGFSIILYELDSTLNRGVHRVNLDGDYPDDTAEIEAFFNTGTGKSVGWIEEGFVLPGWVVEIILDVGLTALVSENKRITYARPCKNPLYLTWINTLGGWDYWLFESTQTERMKTARSKFYEPLVNDLAIATGRKRVSTRESGEFVRIGVEQLTDTEAEGLKDLIDSPLVYEMNQNGERKEVLIKQGSFTMRETKSNRHSLQIELEYPERYRQV